MLVHQVILIIFLQLWIIFHVVHLKAKVYSISHSFFAMISRYFSCNVKTVISDDETKFFYARIFNENGIVFQTSCVDTLQQNRWIKRRQQHILNVTWVLMFPYDLPILFWVNVS